MNIDANGNFSLTISGENLFRGLRPSKRVARNAGFLVEAKGSVGRDGVFQSLDSFTRFDTSSITDGFPFPQIFVFTSMIIVCGLKTIYEVASDGSLSLKYTATTPCGTWSAVDFYDYVYISNGIESVIRDAGTKTYAISTKPHFTSCCNYNGQVIIGAPDEDHLAANLSLYSGEFTSTATITGSYA